MSFKEIFDRVERTAEYWQERLEIEEGELRLANAEIAALREALEGCYELTRQPTPLTVHLNKALEATK